MQTLRLDLRYSVRALQKSPLYAIVTILLLAVGIGANTAIFSVVNSVLLRPLPYEEPDRLVVALHQGNNPVSPADYLDYRKSVHGFQDMAAAQIWSATLSSGDRPEHVQGVRVTPNMMPLLGVAPMLGRSFRPEEQHGAASQVVLLSHGLWTSRFGADPNLVGREVSLDHVPYTVIGIMPPDFSFPPFWATRAQMWTPLDLDMRLNDRGGRSLRVFARLAPGVTVAQAQSEIDSVASRLAEMYPQTNAKLGISVVPLHEKVVGPVRVTLLVLLGTVAFVLLIACANVGSLALARALARRKEMAVRRAMGASRGRLIRTALTEILVLAALGGVAGVLLANWGIEVLILMLPPASLPRQHELRVDHVALGFSAALTILAALIAGVIPALQAAGADVNSALKQSSRASTQGPANVRTKSVLIGVEVAFALVLLAGAGLMMRTMMALVSVDAGFNPQNVLSMQVSIKGTEHDHDGRRAGVFRRIADQLSATPGIESVSAINHLPIGGDLWRLSYSVEGRPAPASGNELAAVYRVVMPDYFRTMQIGVTAGRDFTDYDNESAAPVAIINEALAQRRWPGENPVGKSVRFGVGENPKPLRTIVGVVRNARQGDWTSPPDDEIYIPYYQRPDSMGLSYLTFVLRTRGNPDTMAAPVVHAVSAVDRGLPVSELASMERVVGDRLWRPRLTALLMGTFAGLAVFLAFVGIYGVISHSMRQRTQEIGIRMALGADSGTILALSFREGLMPILLGTASGLACALVLTRFMQTLLYEVKPTDPLTFASIVLALLAICALANVVPALRATRTDPLGALRCD